MNKDVEELLNNLPSRPGARTLDNMPDLVAAVEHFLTLKANHDPRASMSLCWFYQKGGLRDRFSGPSWDAVRRYVQDVLGRSPTTGAKL